NRSNVMTITVEIPEELASQLIGTGQDPARAALEAIALEGYRADRLSETEIRELLGFETRMEVHSFLKEHGVFLHYSQEDFVHDSESPSPVAEKTQKNRQHNPSGERRAG